MPTDSSREPRRNYGIPARMPASTALWAHLLGKDTLSPALNSTITIPPLTPLDKNGTSMRILLHDTQAHLDTFSDRVDKLCSGVNETKQEISMVNTLFQREHETLTGELVDLVNRSQTQLQKSIGTPAQAEQLEILSKDLNTHLEALNKRIDAIQLFNQTHSQTLQLQSQALQSLQDQHGTVLAAIIPLLPLLQTIPFHIDSARNSLTETITKCCGSSTCSPKSPEKIRDRSNANNRKRGSKRTSSTFHANDLPSPLTKRPRITTDTKAVGSSRAYIELNITEDDLSAQPTQKEPSRTEMTLADSSTAVYISQSVTVTPSSLTRSETIAIPNPRPMPLVNTDKELERQETLRQTPKPHIRTRKATLTTEYRARPGKASPANVTLSSPAFSEDITPSVQRPPRHLRVHSTYSKAGLDARPNSTNIPENGLSTLQSGSTPRLSESLVPTVPSTPSSGILNSTPYIPRNRKHVNYLSPTADEKEPPPSQMYRLSTPTVSSRLPLTLKPLHPLNPRSDANNLSMMLPPGPGGHSTQTSRASSSSFSASRPPRKAALAPRNMVPVTHVPFPTPSDLPLILPTPQDRPESMTPSELHIGTIASTQNIAKVRERRSPFREGRRFIPLGDSEDDDDDDDDRGG